MKDERLYARFDISMDEHPKIMLLSDAAFRAAIEATLFARRQLTDGFLHEGVVLKKWGRDVATELSTNHPERPTWSRVEGGWQIRDYHEHQTTRADIEKAREAGRRGGLASATSRSTNRQAGGSKTVERFSNDFQPKTETETETETTTSNEVVREASPKRGSRLHPQWKPSPAVVDAIRAELPGIDIAAEHRMFVDHWKAAPGEKGVKSDWDSTWRNWMRRSVKFNPPTKLSPEDRARRTLALVGTMPEVEA